MQIREVMGLCRMRFLFAGKREGYALVSPRDLYKKTNTEYGFLTEENHNEFKELQIVELNHGMEPSYWCQDEVLASVLQDEEGCFIKWDKEGLMPLTFVQKVTEGNYKVSIVLYAKEEAQVMVFLGRRRLLYQGKLKADETVTLQGLVNVCPVIPRNYTTVMEDNTVDVTILGKGVHIREVEITPWEGRTIYIAGDSTVTDQSAAYPYYPWNSYCGWGQMLSCYLKDEMAVSNHAHSGLTTESFRTEGHYNILIERIRKDDICLFQFGHNDQKQMELKAYEGYQDRLLTYIEEIKKVGAIPVLVSPLARNSWLGTGAYNDLLAEYAEVCKEIAAKNHIPFVDLHARSMAFITNQGREEAKRFFFPSDYTHSNDYGAYLFAGYVYEELVKAQLVKKSAYSSWLPDGEVFQIVIPKEYANKSITVSQELFTDLERPEEPLTRIEALDMVIQTMKFFPTNVYNDAFIDIIGHESYAGTVECAWQNDLIPEEMISEHRFEPQKKITGEEFATILIRGIKSRTDLACDEQKRIKEKVLLSAEIKRIDAANLCKQIQI